RLPACYALSPVSLRHDLHTAPSIRSLHDALPISREYFPVWPAHSRGDDDRHPHGHADKREMVPLSGELHIYDHVGGEGDHFPFIDRKSSRLNSSHEWISYALYCLTQDSCFTTSLC